MKEPEIRFKGFDGEWNSPIIEKVFELRNGYTPSKAIKEYWENGTIPWFRMEDIRAKGNILSDAFQKITPLAVKGGGLFKPNSIILATTATIGVHAMLIADSLANQQFTNFKICESLQGQYAPLFVNNAFYKIDKWSERNTNSGGLLAVDIKSLVKEPFYTPSLSEQRLIASYFQSLDTLIQATSKQLASLKQIKAASLQSMFPQKGETKPMVRFKGFDGEWNTRSFADTFIFLKNNSLSRAELSEHGTIRNIHYGDILIKFGALINITQDDVPFISDEKKAQGLSANYQLQEGDIIFADAAEDLTVGKCSELISTNKECVVAGLHTIPCRPQLKFAEGYLGYYLNSPAYHNQLLPLIQGTKISSISKKTMNCTNIFYPPKEQEQQKIASYFRNLDRQITLQARRLEKLKQIKAACLDKMFV